MAWSTGVPDSSHSITADLIGMRDNFTETKTRLDNCDAKFDPTTGHIHDGTPGDAPKISWNNLADRPDIYTPAAATASTLGCIKIGAGLTMNNGVCSVEGSGQARFRMVTSSGNFTVPSGITTVYLTMSGGGGAGGAGSSYSYGQTGGSTYGGSGGRGGACFKKAVTVTMGTTYSVVVGVGGKSTGVSGGPTSFSNLLSVTGGGGGGNASGATNGTSGTSGTGYSNLAGYGTGGSGGYGLGNAGGAGADGVVLIEW